MSWIATGSSAKAKATRDPRFLGELAELNQAARADAGRPPITLCTGRPAPDLELMLQVIDGDVPGVHKNGAGIYLPGDYRFLKHPSLHSSGRLAQIRQRLEQAMVGPGHAYFQPGKEYSLTLFATDPEGTSKRHEHAEQALGSLSKDVELVYSSSCLNVLPREIDKGKGVEYLAELTDLPLASMLGVGDSDVDLPFLASVGLSAAPANGNDRVKSLVEYVSPLRTTHGVRDILRHYGVLG